jgi:hypothetical protein
LRSPENHEELDPELLQQYQKVNDYIGDISSQEVSIAHEELVQDIVVRWILAGEDSSKVEWCEPRDLTVLVAEI